MQGKLKKTAVTVVGGAILAMLVSLIGGATAANSATVRAGNIVMNVDGQVLPPRLPARGMAPAKLFVRGAIRTTDGEHPSPMQRMILDFDKAGMIFNRGLPTCRAAQIENTTPEVAKRTCGRALVGQGKANAQVKFPDQDAFQAPADDMMIFNASGRGGEPDMLIHAYAFVPLPTTFVVPVYLRQSPNKRLYRHRAIIPMPEIAGGNGSLTDFRAIVGRNYRFRGKPRSYIYAGCPNRVHRAEGLFIYRDGTRAQARIAKRCQQRPVRRR